VALLERATALEPDALEVRHTFALALIAAGDHKRARDVLTTILRLDPAAPDVWTNIGTLDLQRGAMREAQHAFERALAGDPGSVAALKGLGASQETLHPARAAQQWERALALAPNDHQLLARLAFLLAKLDPARAQPYLERLIREAPSARFASEKQRARELLAQIKVKGR
jgi:tetratricopeptide (TPR) repeat protein